ncbi:YgfZ/GcvT domain-containing protein [Sulfuriflexus mobilis]|uniref:CAF17-like 4Fe-4S cluster assembly/insertion protein YgfZ n=1 Tax=Sulfuriflexus mobilis TaxID=1811807 RepID=UPI0015587330|nr:folate-binding protein YgfZ [Sulfuriflexus mobilis]
MQNQQARLDEQGWPVFADAHEEAHATKTTTIMADMSPIGVIRISGEEATDFLQGQFSNDIKQIDEQSAQLNSYCSPKGRILASFWLYRQDNAYYMLLPVDNLPAILKRLKMYVLMAKVTLEDVSEENACLGLAGPEADSLVQQHLCATAIEASGTCRHGALTLIRLPGKAVRYLLSGPVAEMRSVWQKLSATCTPVGYRAWQLLDIEAGLPSVYLKNVEAFVPQMINLHAINGISFKKGCYPGQEIVARMHYLGKLKRRMYRARVDCDNPPQAGDALFAPDGDSGQGTGRVVMASPAVEGGYELLAVVQINSVDNGDVHLHSAGGPLLNFIPLDYPVPLEREA